MSTESPQIKKERIEHLSKTYYNCSRSLLGNFFEILNLHFTADFRSDKLKQKKFSKNETTSNGGHIPTGGNFFYSNLFLLL